MIQKQMRNLMIATLLMAFLGSCIFIDQSDAVISSPWIKEISSVNDYPIHDVEWSPDGNYIAMVGYRVTPGSDVLVYDIKTNNRQIILGSEDDFSPASVFWSPDGDFLIIPGCYISDPRCDGMWLVPINGDPPSFVTQGIGASYSPDGNRLAILVPTINTLQIKLRDMNTGSESVLTEIHDDGNSLGLHIEWSPNGDLLAFTSETIGANGSPIREALYLLDPEHPEPHRVFSDIPLEIVDFAWFPDGEWMALSIQNETNRGLYLASLEEECLIPLLPRESYSWSYIDVSPDGTQLVISDGDAYIVDLEAAAAEGVIEFPLRCP